MGKGLALFYKNHVRLNHPISLNYNKLMLMVFLLGTQIRYQIDSKS